MDSYNAQLRELELRLRESAIEQGYSFEDDPFGERVPPSVDPRSYYLVPEGRRWLAWAVWGREGDDVVIRVGPLEAYRFEWAAFEDLHHRYAPADR